MATTSNCFSGIFRRLLCSGTHPPDSMTGEFNHYQDSNTDQNCGTATSPGIVARLMGLDSLPETDHSVPRRRTSLESILRSRSANSINYIPEFDLFQTHDQHHRRAKTSVSFREFPTFLDEPSFDLFLSCLEGVGDRNIMRLSVAKSDMGFEEKRKTERNRGGVIERSEEVVESIKVNKPKVVVKNKNKKCVVSRVLREKSSREPVSSSRKRLARKYTMTEYEYPRTSLTVIEKQEEGGSDDEDNNKLIGQIDYDFDWLAKGFVGFEEVEWICNEFGQKLLDDMLLQVVNELNMD